MRIKAKGLILLPAYNAEDTIENAISKILLGLDRLNEAYDILAINDGSNDETSKILKRLSRKNPKIIIKNHSKNIGLAGTLREGYTYAIRKKYRYVIRTDADNDQDQREIVIKIAKKMSLADVVVARRKFPNPQASPESHIKAEITPLINELFDLKFYEPASGNLGVSKDALKRIMTVSFLKNYKRRWAFDASTVIIAKKMGFDVDYVNVKGFYDEKRRPVEKIVEQYETYLAVIKELHDSFIRRYRT